MGRSLRISNFRWCLGVAFVFLAGCSFLSFLPTHPVQPIHPDIVYGAPDTHSLRIAPYIFLSDKKLDKTSKLFQGLAKLRDQVYQELDLIPSPRAVHVFLFQDRPKYEKFMALRYPEQPKRRAFFVADPTTQDLLVYTFWSDKIEQDLRHELTHALLHSVLKDVPLWLDEGLAEYFEIPPEAKGLNKTHLNKLAQNQAFTPNLTRLEGIIDLAKMTPTEYRESWAWVHMMLQTDPRAKQVLLTYIHELRRNPTPSRLAPRLRNAFPDMEGKLMDHIGRVHDRASVLSVSAR
ncbi:MAG: hypothetical protein ACFCD0_07505 [Gemmataceae bacterium]